MTPLRDVAQGKWRSILPQLGIETRFLSNKHGPCPACGGRDRFRFDDQDGRGTFFCNGDCGAGDGISLLQKVRGWSFKEVEREVRAIAGDYSAHTAGRGRRDPADNTAASARLWRGGRGLTGDDPASQYLAARGVGGIGPAEIRWSPSCVISGHPTLSTLPAMLALIRGPDGAPVSVHRTYIVNGAKADVDSPRRVMPGTIPKGSAIRLCDHHGILGVAEGIETALAVTRDFGIPCWATLDADKLAGFIWDDAVRELHIFGDADRHAVGQAAAWTLARRAGTNRTPLPFQVHVPPTIGDDWLDHGNRLLERSLAA